MGVLQDEFISLDTEDEEATVLQENDALGNL